jgi:hypothetical protein
MAQGITEKRQLAQYRKTAQQATEAAGEQPSNQGPLHERLR